MPAADTTLSTFSGNHRLEMVQDLNQLPAAWDALLSTQSQPTPFMQRAYLQSLQTSGSAVADTGWQAHFVLLWRDDGSQSTLVAACPLYLKPHSRGEYVFDHAWAQAYAQHGLDYYPKLLCAVPFTPVQGSRLLAVDAPARAALVAQLQQHAQAQGASSVHVLFGTREDHAATAQAGWAARQTVQFHWTQPSGQNYPDYETFLKTLTQDKAKKARAEARKVSDAGVRWRHVLATSATPSEVALLQRCYAQTYREHGNAPYLSAEFFTEQLSQCPKNWLLCIASHPDFEGEGDNVHDFACSLIALDPVAKVAYGRYWGALARVSCLHFDACYYQPLRWCIANGYVRFEGGAQGEHKMARGLLPVLTQSAHYIAHPQFADAILRFTQREQQGMAGYLDELVAHSPLR